MKNYKWFYVGLGALIALMIGGGAFAFSGVSADEGLGSAVISAISDDSDMERRRGPRDGNGRGRNGNNAEFLAAELGVTVEDLEAAWDAAREASTEETTREERQELFAAELDITVAELEAAGEAAEDAALAEGLANGDITQEQFDLIEAKEIFKELFDKKAAMADALGLTVEELEAAKDAGTDKEALLEEAGITRDELKAAVEEAKAQALADAVANGDLTAEQAELIENAPERGRGGRNGGRGNGQNDGPTGGDQADA
ncbi:MAG: hypothetical protein AAF902_08800 [Chloroflexota bacterium]